jgi:phosphate uptake regulator
MVLSFFRRGEPAMQRITAQIVGMLGDARHSFDAATAVVVGGADVEQALEDIRSTDERINRTEHELRRELVVHVSVQGASDIGQVLSYTLLIKKIERIGDQAKNIVDLALEGVDLSSAPDVDEYRTAARAISDLFGEVSALLLDPTDEAAARVRAEADALHRLHESRIRDFMHSAEPGHFAVPRAVLHRYLKRIVANLGGVALTFTEPLTVEEDDPED